MVGVAPAYGQPQLASELFGSFPSSSAGAPAPIGSYARGCLAGGIELPETGPGWQAMRLSRNRNWGHPEMIAFLQRLSVQAQRAGWPRLYVGDISQPRGGPMRSGHRSHQIGLDADIWLRKPFARLLDRKERERIGSDVVVTGGRVNKLWTPSHHAVLRAAASDRAVARIFVNPAIKAALCQDETGDRTWLRKIRPWRGHNAHFHVRLACPEGAGGCVDQSPPPAGDGCGADLDRLLPKTHRPEPKTGNRTPPYGELPDIGDLPRACLAVASDQAAPPGDHVDYAFLESLPVFLSEDDTAYEGFVGTRYFWRPQIDHNAAALPNVKLVIQGPLPQGLEFQDRGNGNGLLTGVPIQGGEYRFVVRAKLAGRDHSLQRVVLRITDLAEEPARKLPSLPQLRQDVYQFIARFAGAGCFHARPVEITHQRIAIETFGFTVQPFNDFDEAFRQTIGLDARIGGRLIAPNHCEAMQFVHALAHSDRPEPEVTVERADLRRDSPLRGVIRIESAAPPIAVIVDDLGRVWDLPLIPSDAGYGFDVRVTQPGRFLLVVIDPVEPGARESSAEESLFKTLDRANHLGNLGMSARPILITVL